MNDKQRVYICRTLFCFKKYLIDLRMLLLIFHKLTVVERNVNLCCSYLKIKFCVNYMLLPVNINSNCKIFSSLSLLSRASILAHG